MKTQTFLIMAAMSVLPLNAQTPAPVAPAAGVVLQHAADQSRIPMPADCEFVLSANNIPTMMKALVRLGIMADTEGIPPVQSATLALSPQAVKLISILANESNEISEAGKEIDMKFIDKTAKILKQTGSLGPVYLAFTLIPGENLEEQYNALMEQAKAENQPDYVEMNGYKGVKLDLSLDEGNAFPLAEALKGRSLYILSKMVGDTLVIAAAENPEDIHQDASIWANTTLGEQDYLVCRYSAEFANALNAAHNISPAIDAIMKNLNTRHNNVALAKLAEELKKLDNQPKAKLPGIFSVWQEGSTIHLDSFGDACGFSFAPAKGLCSGVDVKKAAFFLEFSPMNIPYDINLDNIKAGLREQALQGKDEAQIAKVKETTEQFIRAWEILSGCIGGANALIVTPEAEFAYTTGVTDRAAFVSGLNQVWNTVYAISAEFGMTPEEIKPIQDFLDRSTKKIQDSTDTVFINQDGEADRAVTLTDKAFVFSTNREISKQLAGSADAAEFSGFRFSINIDSCLSALTKFMGEEELVPVKEVGKHIKTISGEGDIKDGVSTYSIEIETK